MASSDDMNTRYDKLSKDDLKAICRGRNLHVSGTNQDLRNRLKANRNDFDIDVKAPIVTERKPAVSSPTLTKRLSTPVKSVPERRFNAPDQKRSSTPLMSPSNFASLEPMNERHSITSVSSGQDRKFTPPCDAFARDDEETRMLSEHRKRKAESTHDEMQSPKKVPRTRKELDIKQSNALLELKFEFEGFRDKEMRRHETRDQELREWAKTHHKKVDVETEKARSLEKIRHESRMDAITKKREEREEGMKVQHIFDSRAFDEEQRHQERRTFSKASEDEQHPQEQGSSARLFEGDQRLREKSTIAKFLQPPFADRVPPALPNRPNAAKDSRYHGTSRVKYEEKISDVTLSPDIDRQRIPHIFISGIPNKASYIRHLAGMLGKFYATEVKGDISGFYILFDRSVRGEDDAKYCYNRLNGTGFYHDEFKMEMHLRIG